MSCRLFRLTQILDLNSVYLQPIKIKFSLVGVFLYELLR